MRLRQKNAKLKILRQRKISGLKIHIDEQTKTMIKTAQIGRNV